MNKKLLGTCVKWMGHTHILCKNGWVIHIFVSILLPFHVVMAKRSKNLLSYFGKEQEELETGTQEELETGTQEPEQSISRPKQSKHRESYDPSWAKAFSWLEYKPEHGLYCTLCKTHNLDTSMHHCTWTKEPCTQLRKDKILEHQRSQTHLRSVEAERTRVGALRSGGIAAAFEQQFSLQRQAVIGALKVVYWLVKEEMAHHTKYESLLQLAVSLGCSYINELNVGGNAHYTSHRIIDEFVEVLSDCVAEDTLSKINESSFIGLMCDESTDVGVKSQLAVFVQVVYKGESMPFFLRLSEMPDGKAKTIEQSIVSLIHEVNISGDKIVGFGSDGASNMTGRHSGVATRLKRAMPELVSVHCCAHRVALAASQSVDGIPYLKKFKKQISSLFTYFHNSPLRSAGLREVQDVLDDPKICLKRVADTRWLSHDIAVATIRRMLPFLIAFLESQSCYGSKNIQFCCHGLPSQRYSTTS